MNTFILSPCGISILINEVDSTLRKLLNEYANEPEINNVPKEVQKRIEQLVINFEKKKNTMDIHNIRNLSAELIGIILYYNNQLELKDDYHLILSTDTWLGEVCATLIQKWLLNKGAVCEIFRQQGLQTRNVQDFHYALSEMAPKLFKRINDFKTAKNRIIFNLTAGFKVVVGFLQSLGMLHAGELIYVFEFTSHPIRMPKVPINISVTKYIREYLQTFRKLINGLEISEPEIKNVPETMILKIGDEYLLSTWGNIFMTEAKNERYTKKLLPPICSKVQY